MSAVATAADVANIIQLAVAPVFLLAGIAGFLAVLSGRLSRIIDRARVLQQLVARLADDDQLADPCRELRVVWRRANIIHWAIGLCTTSALLICLLIASLFVGSFLALNIGLLVVGLFVIALLLLIFALLLFLNEVRVSTRTLRLGGEFVSGVGRASDSQ